MIKPIMIIVSIGVVNLLLRFLPFWVFHENQKTPKIILYLSKTLPFAVMGMLVVYAFKDVDFSASPFGFPEILCCGIVMLLHAWKKNTLLSIGVGTVLYMILHQFVF